MKITESYFEGDVFSSSDDKDAGNDYSGSFSGGLIGQGYEIEINNSYSTGTISSYASGISSYLGWGSYSYSGGLIGRSSDGFIDISSSYSISDVSLSNFSGGLVGYSKSDATVTTSYFKGNISSDSISGGLIGYSNSETMINNSYSISDVSGIISGGLIGNISSSVSYNIINSYTSGTIIATKYTGGIVGEGLMGICSSVYYNSEGTEQVEGSGALIIGAFGKTTDELKQQETFVDWNFEDVWKINTEINDGYPYLCQIHSVDSVSVIFMNEEEVHDSVKIEIGETITAPENPDKNGFYFVGWYDDDTLFDFTTPIKDNIIFTAEWVEDGGSTPISKLKKSDSHSGIRFAQNIVSDKAEITINAEFVIRNAELKIYDMAGNVVYSATGNGNFVWDLRNSAGRTVANGTYLVITEVKAQNGMSYHYSAKLGVKRSNDLGSQW